MTKRTRNHAEEYRRRLERSFARGLSRAQARGHARAGERKAKATGPPTVSDRKLEAALKAMKRGAALTEAAKTNRISPERLRRYLKENTDAERKGRTWIIKDRRRFQLPVYTQGRIEVRWWEAEESSRVGLFLSAAGQSLSTNDPRFVADFEGQGARDTSGKYHPFETDLNELYRLDSMGEASIPEIYKTSGG